MTVSRPAVYILSPMYIFFYSTYFFFIENQYCTNIKCNVEGNTTGRMFKMLPPPPKKIKDKKWDAFHIRWSPERSEDLRKMWHPAISPLHLFSWRRGGCEKVSQDVAEVTMFGFFLEWQNLSEMKSSASSCLLKRLTGVRGPYPGAALWCNIKDFGQHVEDTRSEVWKILEKVKKKKKNIWARSASEKPHLSHVSLIPANQRAELSFFPINPMQDLELY